MTCQNNISYLGNGTHVKNGWGIGEEITSINSAPDKAITSFLNAEKDASSY